MLAFYRIIKFAVLSFWRNKWLSFVSISIMILALLSVSLFTILNIMVDTTVSQIREKIDIEVFFTEDSTENQVMQVKEQLESNDLVKSVEFISKEKAMEIFKDRYEDNAKLLESTSGEDNPLPFSLRVRPNDPEQISQVADYIESNHGAIVHRVSYQEYKEVIDRLLKTTNSIKKGGIFLSIGFLVMSLIVVLNTIRIAIYTKRDEIEIMKLVGATNWFIRWPFIVEGMIYGTIATIFSLIILFISMNFITPAIIKFLGEFGPDFISYFQGHVLQIVILQLFISVLIGMVSSLLAVSRHLKI